MDFTTRWTEYFKALDANSNGFLEGEDAVKVAEVCYKEREIKINERWKGEGRKRRKEKKWKKSSIISDCICEQEIAVRLHLDAKNAEELKQAQLSVYVLFFG